MEKQNQEVYEDIIGSGKSLLQLYMETKRELEQLKGNKPVVVSDLSDLGDAKDMWTHNCKEEETTMMVEDGKDCNWCGRGLRDETAEFGKLSPPYPYK
jgi:hypothetical protein